MGFVTRYNHNPFIYLRTNTLRSWSTILSTSVRSLLPDTVFNTPIKADTLIGVPKAINIHLIITAFGLF